MNWSNLSNLQNLSLDKNKLSGVIPVELGNLSNLQRLELAGNQLSGEIPEELGNLSSLQVLVFWGNELSGPIPASLGNLLNLEVLDLIDNKLSGEIPEELGNLSNLKFLYLFSNKLSGEIPEELGNLSKLTDLDLSYNQLSGEIPIELGNLSNLYYLDLDNNELSEEIPLELSNLSKLIRLDLHNNQLSGEIPSELGEIQSLQYLLLQHNQLTGEIPTTISGRSWFSLDLENRPYVASEIGDQEITANSNVNLDLSSHFADLNNDSITYTAENLPDGLMLSSTGIITGQTATTGTYTVTVTGTDNDGSVTTAFNFTINSDNNAPDLQGNKTSASELEVNINGVTVSDTLQSYGGSQDSSEAVVTYKDGGNEVQLENNTWKSLIFGNYNVTENTHLSFQFRSEDEGEIQGIGLDDDDILTNNKNRKEMFKLDGTQNWGNRVFDDYQGLNDPEAVDGWKDYSIHLGQHFTGEYDRFVFLNDNDTVNNLVGGSSSISYNLVLSEVT